MPSNQWEEVLLEQVADEITVGYVGPMASEYVPIGVPFLRSQNVEQLLINQKDIKYISPEFHKQIKKSALRPGDVVIVRTGKPGACAVIPSWLPVSNCSDLVIVRCGPNLDSRFLAYYINSSASDHVSAHLVGAVQQHFNVGSARKIRMLLPDINEQRAIAGILGALDDKIEVNRRMNATLESIARTMFRQWFVDEVDVANWEEKALDEIANFLNGLALQKFPAEGDDYLPVIKISQLRTNDTESADKASTNIPPQYVIEDGDILFSWSGSLVVVAWCGGKGALNQHLFKVTSEKYPKWFYYYWTKHHLADFQEIAAGKATTMGHIQRHHLKAAKVLVPSDKELKEMDKVMSPLLDKIIINNLESRTLVSLRDSLLPKLMRGEVRVKVEV